MRVTLWELKSQNGQFHLEAHVDEEGRLVLSGQDLGAVVASIWGDSDYEYWITLEPEPKERVLTTLVREHFSDPEELRGWLSALGVRNASPEEAPSGWSRLSGSGAGRKVLVADESRDRVLLSLLRRLHQRGVFSPRDTFRAWLEQKRIAHRFSSYA